MPRRNERRENPFGLQLGLDFVRSRESCFDKVREVVPDVQTPRESEHVIVIMSSSSTTEAIASLFRPSRRYIQTLMGDQRVEW